MVVSRAAPGFQGRRLLRVRVTQIISMLCVLWAGVIIGRATADGFSFGQGAYENGQRAAVVLAVVVASSRAAS
jgi:hypothetical protein